MPHSSVVPVLILTAWAGLLSAQATTEYGTAAGSVAGAAAGAGAGKAAAGIFDRLGKSLAGAVQTSDDPKPSPPPPRASSAVVAASAHGAPKPAEAPAKPVEAPAKPAEAPAKAADLTALVTGMDRADMLAKVGKPSMSLSSVESSTLVETCWYNSGAGSVTVTLRDGKVVTVSGAETLGAK